MVKKLDLCYSVANINLYKSHTEHFSLALTVFQLFYINIIPGWRMDHEERKCKGTERDGGIRNWRKRRGKEDGEVM